MTNKELLYIEDALGHENIMKNCCKTTSTQLEQKHTELFNKFLNLL